MSSSDSSGSDLNTSFSIAHFTESVFRFKISDANVTLDKYRDHGIEIVYTVVETVVEDYTATYDGYDITNTHTPGKTSVTVTKQWQDEDDRDGIRAESITVTLLADGEDTGKTLTLNSANDWNGRFTDLDQYKNGKEIEYTVEEVSVEGYESEITGDQSEGYVVINTHKVEKTEISVEKIWDDENDKDGIRPASVVIRLYANGKATDETLTLTVENSWKGVFEELPVNEQGEKIEYTVMEDVVEGYAAITSGDEEKGYTVTNVHVPKKPEPEKPTTPDTSDHNRGWNSLFITNVILLIAALVARKKLTV